MQCYVGQLNRQVLMGPPIIALTYQIQNYWSKSQIGNHSKGYILYVTGQCFMTVQAVSISEVGLAFARSPRAYLLRYYNGDALGPRQNIQATARLNTCDLYFVYLYLYYCV